MRKIGFYKDNFYHVYNRGVDRRDIFMYETDYERFIYSLFECNNSNVLYNFGRRFLSKNNELNFDQIDHEPIVDIVAFCLMPNHFHLLLRAVNDGTISDFMHRLGTSFTNYFNLKYERSGALFQGTFKAKLIDSDAYLMHIVRYIHLNPVDLFIPNFKGINTLNWGDINNFLNDYKWSSHHLYLGNENPFSKIVNPSFVKKNYFQAPETYHKFINQWRSNDDDKISHLLVD